MKDIADYAPKTIDDIVYHSDNERDLIKDIATGAMPFPFSGKNGILLYGIYGTGKTALAKLLPDAIEQGKGGTQPYWDYFACQNGANGASVLQKIQNQSQVMSLNDSDYHYFVLDEVDNWTDSAMATLKSLMNTRQTIFVLTTNFLNKVDIGVQNRCMKVNFNAAPASAWLPLAKRVLSDCGASASSDEKLLAVIEGCKGSAREIVSAMLQIALMQARLKANAAQLALSV